MLLLFIFLNLVHYFIYILYLYIYTCTYIGWKMMIMVSGILLWGLPDISHLARWLALRTAVERIENFINFN